MATVTLHGAYDLATAYMYTSWSQVSPIGSSALVFTMAPHQHTLHGSFSVGFAGGLFVHVEGASYSAHGSLVYTVTGANADLGFFGTGVVGPVAGMRVTDLLAGSDTINGSDGDDRLPGMGGDDAIFGADGNDMLAGGAGNDILDGGAGRDTAVFSGLRSGYTLTRDGDSVRVASAGADGTDLLTHIERMVFSDAAIGFDATGTGGQAYRLYRAALDRTPDAAGLGFWIAQMDKGASLALVAQGFIGSQEFRDVYGASPSGAELVLGFYQNILQREPDQAGYDFWVAALAQGVALADVLVHISESEENQAALVGTISAGFDYTPFP